MQKILIALLALCCWLGTSSQVWAAPPDFGGGVNNEYEFEEVVFINGTPIVFAGSGKDISIKTSEKDDSRTVTYKLELTSTDPDHPGTLERNVTYETTLARYTDKGQTTAQMVVDKFDEEIEIGEDKYELEDYQFSRSDIIDNQPASDYYSGSMKARKTYVVNKDEGQVVIDISGAVVGYENFWGKTETQQIEMVIESQRSAADEEDEEDEVAEDRYWQGTVSIQASDSLNKTLKYADNQATLSSFSGGHSRITNQDMFSHYDFDMPRMVDGQPRSGRHRSSIELDKEMSPRIERLIVPKFRDVGGHWAQDEIEKLYSLDVFEGNSSFFAPDSSMTRVDFTRAIVKGANMRVSLEAPKRTSGSRSKVAEVSPFKDVLVSSPDYPYIKDGVARGIISGISENEFGPQLFLTRAQAITIMIRALGFESNAPTPGFSTSFADDYLIPEWAKDSIYVAREIGLVTGDNYNRINPDQVLTRAEASSMLVRFLNFLEQDLQKDYREDLVLF